MCQDWVGLDWTGPSVPVQQNPRRHTLGWGWWCAVAAVELAEGVAGQVPEDEAASSAQEEEESADVNAGRVAGGTAPCTPQTVNPTLMLLEARSSTCGELADTARRMMVMSSVMTVTVLK